MLPEAERVQFDAVEASKSILCMNLKASISFPPSVQFGFRQMEMLLCISVMCNAPKCFWPERKLKQWRQKGFEFVAWTENR